MKSGHEHIEELKLGDAVSALLNECRMILPGIQALFGFQLIAVYQPPFFDKLTGGEQRLHLAALILLAIAAALVMAPAAYHRQTAPRQASDGFIRLASWLLLIAMLPLAIGICLDIYLLARLILLDRIVSVILAVVMGVILVGTWYVLPHLGPLLAITGKEQ